MLQAEFLREVFSFNLADVQPKTLVALTVSASYIRLTPSMPAVPNCCCSKGSATYD